MPEHPACLWQPQLRATPAPGRRLQPRPRESSLPRSDPGQHRAGRAQGSSLQASLLWHADVLLSPGEARAGNGWFGLRKPWARDKRAPRRDLRRGKELLRGVRLRRAPRTRSDGAAWGQEAAWSQVGVLRAEVTLPALLHTLCAPPPPPFVPCLGQKQTRRKISSGVNLGAHQECAGMESEPQQQRSGPWLGLVLPFNVELAAVVGVPAGWGLR